MAAEESVPDGRVVEQTPEGNAGEHGFSVEVLQVVKDAQQQHGLRHGDYQRYRGYCSRRLRRIRKSLHFMQGDKRRVQPKKITEENMTDTKFLYLPLMSAERCWSYAMQLKAESNTEPRKKFHMVSKLRKGVHYADELAGLCNSDKCDARTKLEAQAYSAWMKATLMFELGRWKESIELYGKAKTIYEKLSTAFSDDVQALYKQRVDEIAPNIRYCAYNIGDETAVSDLVQMRAKTGGGAEDMLTSKIDELIAQTREKQAATLSEVTWRGRTMPVKFEQVRGFLLSLQESAAELASAETTDSKVSVYERLLKDCVEALQVLRDELKDDQNFKLVQRGQKAEGKVSNLLFLHTYLVYIRLTKTVERNLLMIDTLKQNLPGSATFDENKKVTKPQDLVRFYEIIIQNLSEIPNLPGVEEDASLGHEVEVETLAYKAFRCFYVAQTYAVGKKWPEALALYEKVEKYIQAALSGYKEMKGDQAKRFKDDLARLQSLEQQVNSAKYECQASSILNMGDLTDQMSALSVRDIAKKPLIERLDEYVDDPGLRSKKPNLVSFPPDFQPVPCKPLYFDLALNHVEFPDLEHKLEQQKQQKKGITGMVSGWFSWGKK